MNPVVLASPDAADETVLPGAGGHPGERPVRARRVPWRRRRGLLMTLAAGGLALLIALVTTEYVLPPTGSVGHPQAVVVLGGYGNRVTRGVQIAHQEHISTLVVSGSQPSQCPPHYQGLVVKCFEPEPTSTQGEGRAIARLAATNHWDRLLVVAGTTQITRAGLRVERCYGGQVAFAGVDPSGFAQWVYFIAYDQAAMFKAVVWQWGC